MRTSGHLLFFIFIGIVVVYNFLNFVNLTPYPNETSSREGERFGAVVVLTGGTGRVDKGLELFQSGRGGMLILSGVSKGSDLDSIFHGQEIKPLDRISILLDKRSDSTLENALEVRKIVKREPLSSVLLVTSNYHMPRARFIFDALMPSNVKVESYAVESPNFDIDNWWVGKGPFIMMEEFLKYYYYSFKFDISPPKDS
jgi:uncharacterized SAM-binding protein YcdF (DUF218 family)